MSLFKADLHIHSCLSPCGSLDMSPQHILRTAKERGLDIIAITDHNSTRNVKTCIEIGNEMGIYVLPGCEVTTQEEVHCLAYFPDIKHMNLFQEYLDKYLPYIKNDPSLFGYQVAVNRNDEIIYEEERLLIVALAQELEMVSRKVSSLNGIVVPAHIDKQKNSILSQLGFIPPDLYYDALELSRFTSVEEFRNKHPELGDKLFFRNSDAHYPVDIGSAYSCFLIHSINWEEIRSAFTEGTSKIMISND